MNVHLIRVITDDREPRFWAAATARDDAVDRVLEVIPEGWTARLVDDKPRGDVITGMAPGEVRELPGLFMPEA